MNCLEFRRSVGAVPDAENADLAAHAAQCPACTRFHEELRQMDQLIHRALNVAVPTRGAVAPPSRVMQWGLAASLAAALFTGLVLWVAAPRTSLAEQIAAHARGEADAVIRTDEREDPEQVARVMAGAGVRLRAGAVAVSYAQSCPLRGHRVPHLVVQSDAGPVVVLLLANEKTIARRRAFAEGGFEGVIVPAPRGVLAVLGRGVPVDEITARVLAAVDYGS